MFCRKCGNEMDDDQRICDACGEDNAARQGFPWKAVLVTLGCVALLAGLAWVVYFGVTGRFLPKENNIYYKESYSVSAQVAIENRNKVVATMGEDTLTNGQLMVFYDMQVRKFLGENGYYYFDYTKSLDSQVYDKDTGLTWQQYFLEAAINSWKYYRVLVNKAEAAGFTPSEEMLADWKAEEEQLQKLATENEFESVDALIAVIIGPGCNFEDYKFSYNLCNFGHEYYLHLAESIEISDEEIENYFVSHEADMKLYSVTKESGPLADIRQIFIQPEGGSKGADGKTTVYSEAEFAAARVKVQEILDTWLAGEKTAESFAKLAAEKSEDTDSKANGGLLAYLYKNNMTTVDVRHILLTPEGGKTDASGSVTYSEEEWAACLAKAQSVLDTFKAGEQTEARFGELAKEHTKDGNGSVGGIYMDVPLNYMVKPFEEWIFDDSRQYGDTGLVKTQYGYHVMYFVHRDDAVDKWTFAQEREAGDYELIQADDGWHLVYFVGSEEGWIRLSRAGVMDEKAAKILDEQLAGYELETSYKDIVLCEAEA